MDPILSQRPEIVGSVELKEKLFFLAPYKAGSCLLFNMVEDILKFLDIAFVNYPNHFYLISNDFLFNFYNHENIYTFYNKKIVYIGHREVPKCLIKNNLAKEFYVFTLIRNPLDALVSMYYSFVYSHPIPDTWSEEEKEKEIQKRNAWKSLTIDEFVLEMYEFYYQLLSSVIEFSTSSKKFWIIKYEDIIFNKRLLIQYILEALNECCDGSNFTLPEEMIEVLLSKYDIIPEKEDITSHIRKVIPGDSKEKLKKVTQFFLRKIFYPLLKNYYPELKIGGFV